MDRVDKILDQWKRERPDLDTAAMGLIGRLKQLSAVLTAEMEKTWSAYGLNGPSFDVLATLRRTGPPYQLSPGELLESMMVSSGTTTNRIDQLEKAGLVKRVKNPDDKRSVLVSLTDKGLTLIDEAVEDHTKTQTSLASGLSAKQFDQLNSNLRDHLALLEKTIKKTDI